jgi:hypothetical protein
MATTSIESQGVQLQRGDGGGPEVFTLVGQITSIDGPSGSAAVIDVTTLDSTAREKRMGLPDEGQVTLEVIYDPANVQQEGLRSDRAARTLRNFQVVLTDLGSTTFSFSAFVLEFSRALSVDAVVTASITLEITGAETKS